MTKRMKRWSTVLLMVMALPLLMACGSDDDENDAKVELNQIVGTWMCVKSTDTMHGISAQDQFVGVRVTINSDGTYSSTAESFGLSGSYAYNGDTFTAQSRGGKTFVINATVGKYDMRWKGTASNGVSFDYSFKREMKID